MKQGMRVSSKTKKLLDQLSKINIADPSIHKQVSKGTKEILDKSLHKDTTLPPDSTLPPGIEVETGIETAVHVEGSSSKEENTQATRMRKQMDKRAGKDKPKAAAVEVEGRAGSVEVEERAEAGKKAEMEERAESGGAAGEPHTQPNSNAVTNKYGEKQSMLDQIFSKIPNARKEINKTIESLSEKLQLIALERVQKRLVSAEDNISTAELIKLTKELRDYSLVLRWNKRLAKAIEENPSKLLPPGSKGWSLLGRLKDSAAATKAEQSKRHDLRKSGQKKAAGHLGRVLRMPSDEERKAQ